VIIVSAADIDGVGVDTTAELWRSLSIAASETSEDRSATRAASARPAPNHQGLAVLIVVLLLILATTLAVALTAFQSFRDPSGCVTTVTHDPGTCG
jgi:hypothetical protein